MKHSYLLDYAEEILKDNNRAEKIKKTKRRKRAEEHIAVAIMQGNVKRAIDLSEMHGIPPQDFGKLVGKYSPLAHHCEE